MSKERICKTDFKMKHSHDEHKELNENTKKILRKIIQELIKKKEEEADEE